VNSATSIDRQPTALLSVHDKTGVVEFARGLEAAGWRLLASGGTAAALATAGLPVVDVADFTGVPAILDHRVVTLHPRVHGGVLADLSDECHVVDMVMHGIEAIDLVVVNLYPFEARPGVDTIDVGGPALVRAAAKNHARVGVVLHPDDYPLVLDEIARDGGLSANTRRRMARTAFARLAAYDTAIAQWFDTGGSVENVLPDRLPLSLEQVQPLRYGENPHQRAARYRPPSGGGWPDRMVQHQGRELSYLNLLDADAAWQLVHRFDDPAAVVVKHADPCGVAVADAVEAAYLAALDCDPVSAFGGIVAVNRPVTVALAASVVKVFTELLIAPSFDTAAADVLASRPDMRVLTAPAPTGARLQIRPLDTGYLVQETDPVAADPSAWKVVSARPPSADEWVALRFAWGVCAAVSSNAVVVARHGQAVGIGGGQPNRVDAARWALRRAGARSEGGVCASDGFFPFADAVHELAAAGVTAVVQPGGSIRDPEVVAAADLHGLAMVVTGERHFRH
jgi:phosphoribosylaminoimidazolecarboxamide formyltransferase/IMP cyclohydrolase